MRSPQSAVGADTRQRLGDCVVGSSHRGGKPFTSPVGPTVPIPASPVDVFQLFFSADLMENIVRVIGMPTR